MKPETWKFCDCLVCPCHVPTRTVRCAECERGNCMDWTTAERAEPDVLNVYPDDPGGDA